jgi:hypothetical protein
MAGTPNQPIKTKKKSKKSIFSISIVKRSHNFVWGYPTKFAGLHRTPNQPIKSKKK